MLTRVIWELLELFQQLFMILEKLFLIFQIFLGFLF